MYAVVYCTFHGSLLYNLGFPSGSVVKNPLAMQELQEMWVRFLDRGDPLEEGMATHSASLPGESPWTEEPGSQRVGHD